MSAEKPGCGQCRQAGEKLFLKGARCRTAKCPVDKEATTPGQHGKKASTRRLSEYGKQLREKQKVRNMYGLGEAQFRRFFGLALHQRAATGETLIKLLERRVDNVVYRLKMAASRRQARQMIVHGLICINGKAIKSPSILCKAGDMVSLKPAALAKTGFLENVVDKRLNIGIRVPEWLELQKADRRGRVLRAPERSEIGESIEERLIVELYSK
jgi:small subunit ribosomal protein S4